MIESDRRATIRTINEPWVGISPCPTGRISRWDLCQAINCLATSTVPPGLAPFELTNPKAAYLEPSLSLRVLRVFVVNRNQALTPLQPHLIKP